MAQTHCCISGCKTCSSPLVSLWNGGILSHGIMFIHAGAYGDLCSFITVILLPFLSLLYTEEFHVYASVQIYVH